MRFAFLRLLHNPAAKTIATAVVGSAAAALDVAIQHPTGGMATAISAPGPAGIAFTIGSLFAHNLLSRYQFAVATPDAPSAPQLRAEAASDAGPMPLPKLLITEVPPLVRSDAPIPPLKPIPIIEPVPPLPPIDPPAA